jgi:Ca-activated chloride channel family protein
MLYEGNFFLNVLCNSVHQLILYKINLMKRISFFSCLLLVTVTAFAFSTRTITGTVTDDAGNPIIAYISVKGTGKGVSTAVNGSFRIGVSGNTAVLVVTSLGYQQKEVAVGKDSKLSIRLQLSSEKLEEVVVVGLSAQTRKEIAAASQVLAERKMQNLGALNSAVTPGNSSNLKIRGKSSGINIGGYFPDGYRDRNFNREGYDHITDNSFLKVSDNPQSTFSIDVDAASYSNVRRILKSGQLPEEGAVRIEEMINYFSYEYAQPTGKDPFAVHTETAVCPWNTKHQLLLIGLQGKKIDVSKLPPSNLTFLIDVSGSMMAPNRLPLVKESLKLLVAQLREEDKVSIVAYAGNAGLVLDATSGENKITIKEAIDRLEAGGSTAGGDGIKLAYKIARENFNRQGNNRVILCTDGDFNVGMSSDDALERLIDGERKSGVYLTVLGYGTGNYQDAKMQKLADKGNGNHAYIDGISEAKKVLINEFGGTLFTIAKDVKLQLEFNPAKVKGYRLIGYENRMLAREDFNNDKKDAGDMGSGHTVTALYELVPPGVDMPETASVDSLRYQTILNAVSTKQNKYADELLTIKLRYKQPNSDNSNLISHAVKDKPVSIEQTTDNFRFAASVASFGMLLRKSEYKGNSSYQSARSLAANALGRDEEGYRKEFIQLIDAASAINRRKEVAFVGEKE